MATSKTLTPTNVTISIPEFTDQPDQRVNSNCIDKEADAINALNSKTNQKATNFGLTLETSMTLAEFQAFCEGKMDDNGKGMCCIGYINWGIASGIGLAYSGYVVCINHSSNYRMIQVYSSSGNGYSVITKSSGTWQSTWKQVTAV